MIRGFLSKFGSEWRRKNQAVARALGYTLRMDPSLIVRERQEIGLDYGNYAAIKSVSYLGRASPKRVFNDFRNGVAWSDIAQNNGTRLSELLSIMRELSRTTATIQRQLRSQLQPPYRIR